MEPVLSVAEMERVDALAAGRVDALMDAAGFSVAMSATAMGVGYGSVVRVLAGRGNNGGDGYVAARYLARRGAAVTVHHLGLPNVESVAGRAMQAAARMGIRIEPIGDVVAGDLVIDALFGTGFRGELPAVAVPWTVIGVPVLSVDIPSGVSGDTGLATGASFHAQRTATFHRLKTGHVLGDGPDLCGVVDLYDIGLVGGEPVVWRFTDDDVVPCVRPRTAHKWSVGAVATIGGTLGLTGAAVLAARSAIAAGAGMSAILTTSGTAQAYEIMAPDIVAIQAGENETWVDASTVLDRLSRFDALIVGPGLEREDPRFVTDLAAGFEGTLVLDAGALDTPEIIDTLARRPGSTILTPHAGEFERLAGSHPTPDAVLDLAERAEAVVLAKGNPTKVAGDGELIVVDAGGPELATIGTGDVLAGMIGAFCACGLQPIEAATTAAHIHGVAGRSLQEKETVSAPALVREIAATMASYLSSMVDPRRP